MKSLYELGITEEEVENLLNRFEDLINVSVADINNNIRLLRCINLTDEEIKNIILINPYYLNRSIDDILNLFNSLIKIGVYKLNNLFKENPYLLNKDFYEIDEFVKNETKDTDINNLASDINDNPFIFIKN